ncbi:rhomboid family intramembrane serine protease [Chelativorans salis]|uniref:Rhomboid family intramembrane serine protease n=1 Tax=Chelativorans salis TaxID=2978478 RepID=A0ABT2LLH7_9HYPH|nr:rhomboid family intramembrane serine protease [Chelativorans sp. EGI FJ00035]MCT7375440.1 rhomboid family intramembrane serine protease [Chelativorans sp. EGI FJ00035]
MDDGTKPTDAETEDRQEPRHREPVFNLAGVVTALIGICMAVHLIRAFLLTRQEDLLVIVHFAFLPLRYTGGYPLDVYALVSPFTYAFLHGGVAHLAVNMIWLAAFGSPLANRIGTMRFLLLWCATALAAVFLHFVLHPYDAAPLVGASGAVSGMMGAAARFAFHIDRSAGKPGFTGPVLPLSLVLRSRMTVVFLAVWFAVNLIVGLGSGAGGVPRIAWEAHIGGFLVGFFAIGLFDRRPMG